MKHQMDRDYLLFDWNKVPGGDDEKLISHLQKCVKINWLENAEIKKSDDGQEITLSYGKKLVTLKLEVPNKVVLKLSDEELYEYDLIKEDEDALNLYNKDVILKLKELNSEDDEGLEKLSNNIVETSIAESKMIIDLLHSEHEDESSKSKAVLQSTGEIMLTPLLHSLNPDVPEDYVWDMTTVLDMQMENRVLIAKALDVMLDDKRDLKLPFQAPGIEETFTPRRVCDEAYRMMRQLLAFKEGEMEQFFNTDAFLNMSDKERDTEIKRFRTSKRWIPLTEQFE